MGNPLTESVPDEEQIRDYARLIDVIRQIARYGEPAIRDAGELSGGRPLGVQVRQQAPGVLRHRRARQPLPEEASAVRLTRPPRIVPTTGSRSWGRCSV